MSETRTQPGAVRRSAAVMGLATATSRAIGFVRVLVIAAVLGTTHLGNTFQGSNLVSNVLFELLAAGALSAVLVPSFVELFRSGRDEDAEALAGSLLGVALVVLGAVALAGVLAAPAIARVLTSGVDIGPELEQRQHELATFLLRLFIPQVMLYAFGAVATAVLHARRRFAVAAMAPIANTVVVVAGMAVFAVLRDGRPPTLDVSMAEKVTLGLAGTLGVAAFVGVPTVALLVRGFRLRPRLNRHDPLVRKTIRHAAWAGFQNASVGILLGAAIVVGMGVSGGVVAYYVAYTFFLVPYAVLGQSIHDVILPELANDAAADDAESFGRHLRWGLDSMALLIVPAAAAYVALAQPIMEVVSFGETTAAGTRLMAGALAALALGLFPYSAFLLLTRASYALGDSRTPTFVSVGSALVGAAFMVVVGSQFDDQARLVAMGLGVTVAYALASLVLGSRLSLRLGEALVPRALARAVPVAGLLAAGAWAGWRVFEPAARPLQLALLAVVAVVGGAVYAALVHPPSVRRMVRGKLRVEGA